MRLHAIDTGYFKLDGGAMFGVVPKTLWQKVNPADENNLCTWAMRCLLIETGDRLILIDNGIGDKQSAKFFSYYYLHGDQSLLQSIKQAGFSPDEITDVFMTHLHFDHCGGGVHYLDADRSKPELVFKQATYWSNQAHWDWALEPNARERASFLKENLLPIRESGHLKFIDPKADAPFEHFEILNVDGHTEKQMLPKITVGDKTIFFAADLIPSVGHIPIPFVMGFDIRPLLTIQEKERVLKEAADQQWVLFFEHDPIHQCATVKHTERGVRVDQTFDLEEFL